MNRKFFIFLFLSFIVLVFYFFSLKNISANREEQIVSLKSRWISDESKMISFGDHLNIEINKMPPKMIVEFGNLSFPFILFPQHGPLSTILPYIAYKIGSEYSTFAMRFVGVFLGIIMLFIFRNVTPIFLLLYTNAFVVFVLSYTSLFWYVLMLFFSLALLRVKDITGEDNNRKYLLIFVVSFLGVLSHIRFFSFSVFFALIFFNLRCIVLALLGSFLGLTPYIFLSAVHDINLDKNSFEVLFGSPSDIGNFVLNYLLSGDFNITQEIIKAFSSFSSLFFSLEPFVDLGIIKDKNPYLRVVSTLFFVLVLVYGLIDLRKNFKEIMFILVYIFLAPFSNPYGLFNFTQISWQFLLILPFFYKFIVERKIFLYAVLFCQIIFSFFVLLKIINSKTQYSKSEVKEVIDYLESNKVSEVLNLGIFSSIEFESKGSIKSFEGLFFLYTRTHDFQGLYEILKKFDYVVLSEDTELFLDTRKFDLVFETSGKSIKIYKKKDLFK